MNANVLDVLACVARGNAGNQREIAEKTGIALGLVNRSAKLLVEQGYITRDYTLTDKGTAFVDAGRPKRAVILAAGYGMRMVPINTETPKGLLSVHGETLVERLIHQLHQVGIKDITIVVGYLKEQFEFLIDQYQVNLVVNMEYSTKNNLHSLTRVADKLDNCYIVPCDIWCAENPFCPTELYSWYMVTDEPTAESGVRLNRKHELVITDTAEIGNREIGICYITAKDSPALIAKLRGLADNGHSDSLFWEAALQKNGRYIIWGRCVKQNSIVEINTYEQLRELDSHSSTLNSSAMEEIQRVLSVTANEIQGITILKKGMTNRSFLFTCKGKKYIMRIPGEGTDALINRKQEAIVYHEVLGKEICDNVISINPENGYKITEYFNQARVCDAFSKSDIRHCMDKLRAFHSMGLKVSHSFDLFGQIQYYETLLDGQPSVYRDYEITKQHVFSLQTWIERYAGEYSLTHIDAVADNFLFVPCEAGESVYLIDWEYAGMQDPHVDLAMFSIYSYYDKKDIDALIDEYFQGACSAENRIKIYCYVAVCGLLWSNWCEYKRTLGIEFSEYAMKQYRYAKEYYQIAKNEMELWKHEQS